MAELSSGHGLDIYRQARLRTTCAAAIVLLLPFGLFYFLLEKNVLKINPALSHPTTELLLTCVLFGLALALGFGRFVSNHILTLAENLDRALFVAEQRERERDHAQEELIAKLENERELVRQKLQFESQLAEYEKYAALAQLALGAAHEINNPLLGILSHLELELRTAQKRQEQVEIEQCIDATKRISATVRSLLTYARPGPPQLAPLNIERMVAETLAFVRHQPMFRAARISASIAPDLPNVVADANQISQVLMNLLLNAAQAIRGQGEIRVTAQALAGRDAIEVAVRDTGCGIPADIVPHVFAPFFTTKRGKGTGLGLSISQSYIRNHGGDITVESVVDRGTTVRFTLPVQRPKPASAVDLMQEVIS